MKGTYEATPRCQDCDTCCRCFFEAQVVRDVQRDVRLDHYVFGKRPIFWLRCVAPTGASVKSEVGKLDTSTFNRLDCTRICDRLS